MPKIGHLCFPIAFFGHFQYTLTDQERIPHSPSGGDFHGKELIFAFICSQKQLSDYNQVIAIVYWDEFLECVDIEKEQVRGTARLSVKAVKGSPWLRIYGSKRADMLDGKDNTIKIERNRLGNL